MPLPALPIITAGISALGGLIGGIGKGKKDRQAQKEMNQANIDAQLRINEENRQFSKDMWSMTNEYNSPTQQMARLAAAGLNPHLAYGNQPQASQPMAASTAAPRVEKLPVDTTINEIGQSLFQGAQNYLATKRQQTEIDNMEKTSQVMDAEILQKNASTAESMTRNAKTKFDLDLASQLRDNTVEQAILNTKNLGLTSQQIETSIKATQKGMQMTDAQISKIAQDIVVAQKQIQLMDIQGQSAKADILTKELDQKLKRLDINLKELGIQPSDSPLLRIPIQMLNKGLEHIKAYGNEKFPRDKMHIPKSWK